MTAFPRSTGSFWFAVVGALLCCVFLDLVFRLGIDKNAGRGALTGASANVIIERNLIAFLIGIFNKVHSVD